VNAASHRVLRFLLLPALWGAAVPYFPGMAGSPDAVGFRRQYRFRMGIMVSALIPLHHRQWSFRLNRMPHLTQVTMARLDSEVRRLRADHERLETELRKAREEAKKQLMPVVDDTRQRKRN
jgi:hypothetical protein